MLIGIQQRYFCYVLISAFYFFGMSVWMDYVPLRGCKEAVRALPRTVFTLHLLPTYHPSTAGCESHSEFEIFFPTDSDGSGNDVNIQITTRSFRFKTPPEFIWEMKSK